MAFISDDFIPQSAMANSSASRQFSYRTTDTLAATKGANYFDAGVPYGIKNGDVIFAQASDGESYLFVSVIAEAVSVGSALDFV